MTGKGCEKSAERLTASQTVASSSSRREWMRGKAVPDNGFAAFRRYEAPLRP